LVVAFLYFLAGIIIAIAAMIMTIMIATAASKTLNLVSENDERHKRVQKKGLDILDNSNNR
jgi:F0F1-type ATP synthase membrane subunit c/vacuolar-type H+-ATPase subunit K